MAIQTLFQAMFDLRSSIVNSVFDCRLSGVTINIIKPLTIAAAYESVVFQGCVLYLFANFEYLFQHT